MESIKVAMRHFALRNVCSDLKISFHGNGTHPLSSQSIRHRTSNNRVFEVRQFVNKAEALFRPKMSSFSDTTTSSSEEDDIPARRKDTRAVATAKKSTSAIQTSAYTTRRQAALAKDSLTKRLEAEKFLGNFNPETSARERKKLSRKINPPSTVRKPPGALYDEHGIHISSGMDLCDCLSEECPGCFFECSKCNSQKCGLECRVHRKFMYDQIEFHGYDTVVKNPLSRH